MAASRAGVTVTLTATLTTTLGDVTRIKTWWESHRAKRWPAALYSEAREWRAALRIAMRCDPQVSRVD